MTIKQQIHTTLVNLLASINGINKVTKRLLNFEEVFNAPIISVIRNNASKEIVANSNLYKVEAGFEIICYIKTSYDITDSALLTDEAERVLELVEEKILVDETIYDLGVTKIEITGEELIPDYEHNLCYASLSLTITYLTNEQI